MKYGFIYIWYDRKRKMFYIGSHWGTEDDGYICSSNWMRNTYKRRREDFKRRIVARIFTNRLDLLAEEQRWLDMIKPDEIVYHHTQKGLRENVRYYNISVTAQKSWHYFPDKNISIGEKISAAKKGKSTGPCSPEKARAISEAKKRKFAERGYTLDPDTMAANRRGKPQSDEWKAAASIRIQQQWDNGTRKRNPNSKRNRPRLPPINWVVIAPDGVEYQTTNLRQFCVERGLLNTNITKRSGSKGWKAHKAPA